MKTSKKQKPSQQRSGSTNSQQQQFPAYKEEPYFNTMPLQNPAFDPGMMYDTSPHSFIGFLPQDQSQNFNQPQSQF